MPDTSIIAKYSSSQEYLHDLGIQYVWGFEYFRAQAFIAFKDLDFLKIEIHAKEGSTATMISGSSNQEVDGVVEEEKGNDQVGH